MPRREEQAPDAGLADQRPAAGRHGGEVAGLAREDGALAQRGGDGGDVVDDVLAAVGVALDEVRGFGEWD
jgi:hypothetical protein